jgi:hypothetical protein
MLLSCLYWGYKQLWRQLDKNAKQRGLILKLKSPHVDCCMGALLLNNEMLSLQIKCRVIYRICWQKPWNLSILLRVSHCNVDLFPYCAKKLVQIKHYFIIVGRSSTVIVGRSALFRTASWIVDVYRASRKVDIQILF